MFGFLVLLSHALLLSLLPEQAGCRSPLPHSSFTRSCTPFAPARGDNVLAQAPVLPAASEARPPWLAPERFPTDTWPRRSQRTSLPGPAAAGSFGGAGQGPTPPSSTATPSPTPPRRCLRGFE